MGKVALYLREKGFEYDAKASFEQVVNRSNFMVFRFARTKGDVTVVLAGAPDFFSLSKKSAYQPLFSELDSQLALSAGGDRLVLLLVPDIFVDSHFQDVYRDGKLRRRDIYGQITRTADSRFDRMRTAYFARFEDNFPEFMRDNMTVSFVLNVVYYYEIQSILGK